MKAERSSLRVGRPIPNSPHRFPKADPCTPKPSRNHPSKNWKAAFTLVELLVVIAIIGVLSVLIVPSISTVLGGTQITHASQVLTDQIKLARQRAQTINRDVELRFYKYGDSEIPGENPALASSGQFRALQAIEVRDDGTLIPIDRMKRLPRRAVMVTGARSSLLGSGQQTPGTNDPALPGGINRNYQYIALRFRPDGSTTLAPGTNWFVTVEGLNESLATNGARNFFTLQVDPVNGATKGYRPGTL